MAEGIVISEKTEDYQRLFFDIVGQEDRAWGAAFYARSLADQYGIWWKGQDDGPD